MSIFLSALLMSSLKRIALTCEETGVKLKEMALSLPSKLGEFARLTESVVNHTASSNCNSFEATVRMFRKTWNLFSMVPWHSIIASGAGHLAIRASYNIEMD